MTPPPVIRIDRFYAHRVAKVWRALTDPELHAQWWVPGDVRPVVGHRFTLDMGKWGQQACEVLAVENERLFRYRYAVGTLDTTITWELSPENGGTKLRLTHEGFNVDSPLGRAALEGMGAGWPKVMDRIDVVLGGAVAADVAR